MLDMYKHGIATGNSLCSYLNNQKCHFSLLFLYKIRDWEDRTGSTWEGGGEMVKKNDHGAYTVYI
jgi:hypothetical protein